MLTVSIMSYFINARLNKNNINQKKESLELKGNRIPRT